MPPSSYVQPLYSSHIVQPEKGTTISIKQSASRETTHTHEGGTSNKKQPSSHLSIRTSLEKKWKQCEPENRTEGRSPASNPQDHTSMLVTGSQTPRQLETILHRKGSSKKRGFRGDDGIRGGSSEVGAKVEVWTGDGGGCHVTAAIQGCASL